MSPGWPDAERSGNEAQGSQGGKAIYLSLLAFAYAGHWSRQEQSGGEVRAQLVQPQPYHHIRVRSRVPPVPLNVLLSAGIYCSAVCA